MYVLLYNTEPLKTEHEFLSIDDIVDTISLTSAAGLRRPRLHAGPRKQKKPKGNDYYIRPRLHAGPCNRKKQKVFNMTLFN